MKMELPYEHVQVGWVILGSLLLPIPILIIVAAAAGTKLPLLVLAALLLLAATMFGSLKVRVDESSLSLRFGMGLIRRRFALSSVQAFAEVVNPWYYGWGIRYFPGGTLYNVSGLNAIELALFDGRRIRVGTDESAKLYLVLESVLGKPQSLDDLRAPTHKRILAKVRLVALGIVGTLLLVLPFLLHYQALPPVVSLTSTTMTVENLFYGQSFNLADFTKVELLQSLPPIRVRTNGYYSGGTLRGWFSLDRLGQGKLFVELAHPPYIAIFHSSGFLIINYADPVETQRLYGAIVQATKSEQSVSEQGHLPRLTR